jgi:NAD(P)H-dependent flavin oxidoreductase YrpB (nitropropane dioxygenase family)
MLKTKITEMLGIKYPVIQGGMQHVAVAELVAAVSNAGALGILAALTQPTPEDLANEIKKTSDMTDQPFGVNLTIMPTLKPVSYEAYVSAIIEAGVKIVETAGRSPEQFMPAFNEAGVKVIHKCTSVRHGLKAEKIGCAAISIDGFECAGHPGEDDIPGLVLIPRAADSINIPLIASGGFADGRGLVAALSLGADAINMGTRFLAIKEAPVHENIKRTLIEATELQTALILRSLKNTARIFKNSVAEKVLEIESQGKASIEDLAQYVSGEKGKSLFDTGEMESGIWGAGMVAGLVYDIPSASELVERIVADAENIIKSRLQSFLA